jgi:hypothetical protein
MMSNVLTRRCALKGGRLKAHRLAGAGFQLPRRVRIFGDGARITQSTWTMCPDDLGDEVPPSRIRV